MVTGSRSMFINLGRDQDMREKRQSVRTSVEASVRISHSTFGVIETVTRDVSDHGVYVKLAEKPHLPVGSHIKMHMLDSAYPDLAFNMKVVRIDDHGVSLRFVDYELNGARYTMDKLKDVKRQRTRAS